MKTFKGKKTPVGCIVQVDNNGYVTRLSVRKSLQVVSHSGDFAWGHSGSRPAQLAAAILYEVTKDKETARQYYQLFKFDTVANWTGMTFEITETEVLEWLQQAGAQVEPPRRAVIYTEST